MLWLCYTGPIHAPPPGPRSSLTPSEKNSVKFQAASILQPTGQLTEVTAVQIQSDSKGLSAAFHLVTHWCVCNKQRSYDSIGSTLSAHANLGINLGYLNKK